MMFYTQLFTSKRGPLAKIWLAAHWERKLTKAHVFECNLETTIRDIISPKINIGLRTSGHLLLGVVRIYSRKAKYLLADCNDAVVKIKIAFRPVKSDYSGHQNAIHVKLILDANPLFPKKIPKRHGQTDMPVEGLEATVKAITLAEDFTSFDVQFPDISNIDVMDHFSMNQCRSEEITLKENFGNNFLSFSNFGVDSQSQSNGLLDRSFDSFSKHDDAFGDEENGLNLLDFLTNFSGGAELSSLVLEEPQNENQQSSSVNDDDDDDDHHHHHHLIDADMEETIEAEAPTLNETTMRTNEEAAFALEPVTITPNSEKKIGKRKRKLVVDQDKELSNEFIRQQISDSSDLVAALDMAPPTVQLMQWKESGGANKLLSQPCSSVVDSEIKELFARNIFKMKYFSVSEDTEEMRENEQEAQMDTNTLTTDNFSVADSSVHTEKTHTELMGIEHITDGGATNPELIQVFEENDSQFTHPELPSEDSMFVHPSYMEHDTQSTSLQTQSLLDSQDFQERRINRKAQKLLSALKQNLSSSEPTLNLQALCEGSTRSQAATTFLCLLHLKKQQAVHLHQSAPYQDISITPVLQVEK